MRFSHVLFSATLPAAALLAGCALGNQGSAVTSTSTSPLVRSLKGKAHGGQQPVSNGAIAIYSYGTSGYGSRGAQIATGTTDSDGNFNIDYTCPATNPDGPVYILSIGGMPGLNQPENSAIVLGAAVGPCSSSEANYVTINEISTTALAYGLAHFFSVGTTDGTTTDFFGSPSSIASAVARVNNNLIPTLTDVSNGYPRASTSTFTNESAKIITIADILGACVNSTGPDSPYCDSLFTATTSSGGSTPADTLQAAVNMALNPTQNVADLYALVPPSGSSAFPGSLSSQPNDWTLGVSYIAPSLGLGIATRTTSTLDIDNTGRVWFPSNLQGAAGVAYFDPSTSSFSQLYTAPGLTDPQQVAIDINGTAWVNDMSSDVLAAFPTKTPDAPVVYTLPGYTSTAVTVLDDNSIRVGVVNTSSNEPALAEVTAGSSPTYSLIPNTTLPNSAYFIGASLAGDTVGGMGASGTYLPTPGTFDYYVTPSNGIQQALYQFSEDAGQIAFTGSDFVGARGGYNAADDGICIFSAQTCFSMANQATNHHPVGAAIDGAGALWLADLFTGDVQEIPRTNGSYLNGSSQANNTVFPHDSNNGGTMRALTGIGIDATGNVWATNESCVGAGCTPAGGLVISELIGAGTPTINPVSAQVVLNASPGTEPSAKSKKTAKQ